MGLVYGSVADDIDQMLVDNPELADKPVIVGGGKRGVVATACYVARIHGVHSAMPMFKALKACPDAVVIKPHIEKYVAAGREIRRMMGAPPQPRSSCLSTPLRSTAAANGSMSR